MTDKCREAFEDINSPCRQQFNTFIYDSWRINGIAFLENGEYKNPFIQERWIVWKEAWNASHDECAKLKTTLWNDMFNKKSCSTCGHENQGTFYTGIIAYEEAIKKDKVKL